MKGVTLDLNRHVGFFIGQVRRFITRTAPTTASGCRASIEYEQGQLLPVCKTGVFFTQLIEGRLTYFSGKDLNLLLELFSEHFLITRVYLRISVNHVQLSGWALCCFCQIKG